MKLPQPILYVAVVIALGLGIFALVRTYGPSTGGDELQNQIAALKERGELTVFGDDAIANGSRAAYDKLNAAHSDSGSSPARKAAANAEIKRIQMFYLQSRNILPRRIPVKIKGKLFNIDNRLSTDDLTGVLVSMEQAWEYRSRAAMLLGQRPEPKVVAALLAAIQKDPSLSVVYHATRNFKALTGCPSSAVFGGKDLEPWLNKNQAAVQKRLAALVAKPPKPPKLDDAEGDGASSEGDAGGNDGTSGETGAASKKALPVGGGAKKGSAETAKPAKKPKPAKTK